MMLGYGFAFKEKKERKIVDEGKNEKTQTSKGDCAGAAVYGGERCLALVGRGKVTYGYR